MTHDDKAAILSEMDEKVLLADGFEEALIGYATQHSRALAVYDREKCIKILIERDEMSEEEAEEFFSFNVAGAYMGEYTPLFFTSFEEIGNAVDEGDRLDRADIGDTGSALSGGAQSAAASG